jgi:hypothetical protein
VLARRARFGALTLKVEPFGVRFNPFASLIVGEIRRDNMTGVIINDVVFDRIGVNGRGE